MSDPEYPLYPDLSDAAQKEAVELIEHFKTQLSKAAEDAISNLYTDVLPWIESDAWGNFRLALMKGLCDYGNRRLQGEHDFKDIRQAILKEHRADIIDDLNQDSLDKITKLEATIEMLQERNRDRW